MSEMRGVWLLSVASVWGVVSACGDSGDGGTPAAGASGTGAGQAGGSGGKAGAGANGGRAGAGAGTGGGAGQAGDAGAPSSSGGAAGEGTGAMSGEAGAHETGGGGAGGSAGADHGGAGGESGAPEPVRDPRCDAAEADVLPGTGDGSDPYLICLPEQLALVGTDDYPLGSAFALGDSVVVDDVQPAFATIGSEATPFVGDFDGRGHSIHGLTATFLAAIGEEALVRDLSFDGTVDATMAPTSFGLVTNRNSGTLRNVHVDGVLLAGDHVGLLAGTNQGLVEDCSARGTIGEGGAHVGGLLGVNLGTVRRSWSTVSVTANGRVGGLVGRQSTPGLVERSFAAGSVSGQFSIGGLVGTLFGGEIRDSYAQASSVSGPEAGGLVGDITGGPATLTRCYAAPSSLDGQGAEGLVGEVAANTDYEITASYFLDTAPGSVGEALTAVEMQSADSFEGWDFDTVWQFEEDESPFPTLRFQSGR